MFASFVGRSICNRDLRPCPLGTRLLRVDLRRADALCGIGSPMVRALTFGKGAAAFGPKKATRSLSVYLDSASGLNRLRAGIQFDRGQS